MRFWPKVARRSQENRPDIGAGYHTGLVFAAIIAYKREHGRRTDRIVAVGFPFSVKNMNTYHGSSEATAAMLVSGGVNITLGGGELGRGFYTGEHLHEAKAWAFHQSGDRQRNVVHFSTPDADVENLSLAILDHGTAALRRYHIKQANETRTFVFGKDMVWAPIVGSERASGDQYKWESDIAEILLNSTNTTRAIV